MFPVESLYYTIPIFLASLFLVRKALFSIFDPFILTIFTLSSGIGMMLYYFSDPRFSDLSIAIVFVLEHLAFLFGFVVANQSLLRISSVHFTLRPGFGDLYLSVLLFSMLSLFLVLGITRGFNILETNPDLSKNIFYVGGAGLFKRVLPPLIIISVVCIFTLAFFGRMNPVLTVVLLLLPALVAISTGGKSALLVFYMAFVFRSVFLERNYGIKFTTREKTLAGGFIAVTLLAALMFLSIGGIRSGTQLSLILSGSVSQIMDRIIGYGDISIYYFSTGLFKVFTKSPSDFLMYLGDTLLGPLRVTDYLRPLGAEMISQAFGVPNESNFGPNAQVYFVGAIFFGKAIGIFFTFVIGFLVSFLRKTILLSFNKTPFDLIIFCIANILLVDFPVDLFYGLSSLYATSGVFLLTFFASQLAFTAITGKSPTLVQREL